MTEALFLSLKYSALIVWTVRGCICSGINSYYRWKLAQTLEPLWDTVPVFITSTIEINIGIIVGCIPYLAPLIRNGYSTLTRTWAHLQTIAIRRISLGEGSKGRKESRTQLRAKDVSGPVIETRILGGADGKGKFLQSRTLQQSSWWHGSFQGGRGGGKTTTKCYSEV